ncbi:hypothetical protein VMCG_10616 [Cytospora schulzeri]|uniref:Uncharacterized protein n=1 Tax=Cytospora schulzeri TaxID=448051 RepID=A0A423V9P4_9PEZI|nr:hypothetical protein VMCG_10616 [Valsa malicola]
MDTEAGAGSWTGFALKFGLTALCCYGVLIPAYYLWFHPLAKFPGPRLWAVSQIPWTVMFCSGQSHRRLTELHDRYGGIVRIGPDELSFTLPEAWDSIMGTRRGSPENPKAPWYCPPDSKHIAAAPWDDHTRMRRILSPSFSAASMIQQQPIIRTYVDLLIKRLHEKSRDGNTSIDIGSWLNYCAFDIIGDLSFGEPFGCLQESAIHPWISLIFANLRTGAIGVALSRFPLLRIILPLLVPKKLRQLGDEMKRFSQERVMKRLAKGSSRPDFIHAMSSNKGGLALTREEIENNAFVLTMAGSETTATALTGAIYQLATNPGVMESLKREVRASFTEQSVIDLSNTAKLPYLCAVTQESLRIYPPGPNAQPRITPSQGNVVLGERLPGNTVLGIPQRAMFLSESNFKRAKEFIPERWLGDVDFLTDRKDCFNPFSVGPRNCIGMNLAYAEFRMILARIVWSFEIDIAECSCNWMEDQRSYLHWDKTPLYVYLSPRS